MAEWYYAQDEEQHGPVSAAALKEMAQAGKIGRDDLIWREGMQRWAPAHKVRGLFPEEVEADASSGRAAKNGRPGKLDAPASEEPISDVLPADEIDADNDALDEEIDDDDDSVDGENETAIDVLPLGGPEESKLHVPVLTAPEGTQKSQRSASDEIVVFEPASVSPPPPTRKTSPSESGPPPTHDSAAERQTRIDVPQRHGRGWGVGVGLFLQTFTLVSCLLVILIGGVVFLAVLMSTADPSQRLAASGIYATFVLASYCLARSTERICRACGQWLGVSNQKQSRRNVRERNWQRFQ